MTNAAPQLLICYEYAQHKIADAPFSISFKEVEMRYGHRYSITIVETSEMKGDLRGEKASESAFILRGRVV